MLLLIEETGFKMNIEEFCEARPYLYHLTDRENSQVIIAERLLKSTVQIAYEALSEDEAKEFLRSKRTDHKTLTAHGLNYKIRDQKPISLLVLGKSLSDGDTGDFIEILNNRVFWWPTLDRLVRHHNRYIDENPIIFRVRSSEMLGLNPGAEFCHLNSGATRCHPSHGGHAPMRGSDSFLPANLFNREIGQVAEVTFVDGCQLPDNIWTSGAPDGPWQQL